MKIVGIGYPRTGTKTLGTCFRTLGMRNMSWDGGAYERFEAGDRQGLMNIAERFDSFEDLPWCHLYREFDDRFPGSKFILTLRNTERAWFESFRKHDVRLNNDIYIPSKGPEFEETMAIYREHNAAVRSYFKDRPGDFMELCWEHGDGWQQLCEFLERPIPSNPFPHVNKTPKKSTYRLFRLYLKRLTGRGD